ncbi:MAG: FlgD immunoglobulin-like domain containing protein [Candidatus Krumholzibacteria bacterium]
MRGTALVLVLAFVTLATMSPTAWAKKRPPKYAGHRFTAIPEKAVLPADITAGFPALSLTSAATDTFHLAWYGFNTSGAPDPQGWVAVDLTQQLDVFFHVADGTELNGGQLGNLLPVEGTQSMWCGVVPSTADPFCGWATLPGYGNGWDQIFASSTFVCDSLFFCYKIWWDSEVDYDFTDVEYFDEANAQWVLLPASVPGGRYNEQGLLVECFAIPVPADSTRLRFHFTSDGAWSDEDGLWPTDGAVIVDSITVDCFNGGILTQSFFEDFEGEAPGSKVTDDGRWAAETAPAFGTLSALYPGIAVLQEDECFFNISWFWGFFDSPVNANYACHLPDPRPDQGVIPFGRDGLYIDNEIWSPRIPLTGAGDDYRLNFKVYRDLPLDNLIFYTWAVRSWVANCPGYWQDFDFVFYGGGRDWSNQSFNIGSLVDAGATELQISLGVLDMCAFWCQIFGTGQCHSHAPLWDDVHLDRVNVVGPQFTVRHLDIFQDNFAQDGTLTGAVRADAAVDIASSFSPTIHPGDSITITVTDPQFGVATDPFTGVGPAVYLYAALWPPNQPGKAGADLEAPETRGAGKRYPLVDSLVHNGVKWYCFRGDSVVFGSGAMIADRFCLDLNDAVLTPGDTICYVLSAQNANGDRNYFSRTLNGQGGNFVTNVMAEALASPMEFTALPAGGWLRGGNILYVDDTDDRGGPAQLFFDTAFDYVQSRDLIDRFDVLGPSSAVGNSLASRVQNVATQIMSAYSTIIWNTGNLSSGLIGDGGPQNGGGGAEKSDDYALIYEFLDTHPDNPGIYISGDDVASEWVNQLTGIGALNTRSIYMNFNMDPASPFGDHVAAGEPLSPLLDGVGTLFVGDQLIVFGGCPLINDFDLLAATGLSVAEMNNTATGKTYVLSQETPNAAATTGRVVLSGFSYHFIRDTGAVGGPPARVKHLRDILLFLQNLIPVASGFEETPQLVNRLDANYPNPFNPTTTIHYSIRERGHVSLRVYNAAGQLVRTLVNEIKTPEPGGFSVPWDGRNQAGQKVSSSVYFYKMVTQRFTQTKKMVLLK